MRKSVSKYLRFKVLQRDGFKCIYCGASGDSSPLEVDHIVPVAEGGSTDLENLAAACVACNRGKRASDVIGASHLLDEWRPVLEVGWREVHLARHPIKSEMVCEDEDGHVWGLESRPHFLCHGRNSWSRESNRFNTAYAMVVSEDATSSPEIREAVACAYEEPTVFLVGSPSDFRAVAIDTRRKGNPMGVLMNRIFEIECEVYYDWYPDEDLTLHDILDFGIWS